MKRVRSYILAVLLIGLVVSPAGASFALRQGDRVVFFGDGSVYQSLFSLFVESFVQARYGDLGIKFYHEGENRRTFKNANESVQERFLDLKPTVGVICLGMDDGARKPFEQERFDETKAEIDKLFKTIASSGCRVYVITPPCPDVSRREGLQTIEYDKVIGKIADAVRAAAAANGFTVIDWYAETQAYNKERQTANSDVFLTRDGIVQEYLSHTMVSRIILDTWRAGSISARVNYDWESGKVRTTAGSVTVKERAPDHLTLELSDFPIPWPIISGRSSGIAEKWSCAKYSQIVLKMTAVPQQGLVLGSGRNSVPVLPAQLKEGFNLAVNKPIRQVQEAKDIWDLTRQKNGIWRRRQAELNNTPPQPELAEGHRLLVRSLEEFYEGYCKILAGLPRTFNTTLEFIVPMPEKDPSRSDTPSRFDSVPSKKDRPGIIKKPE